MPENSYIHYLHTAIKSCNDENYPLNIRTEGAVGVAADHPVDHPDPKTWRELVVEIKPNAALGPTPDTRAHRRLSNAACTELADRSVMKTDWNSYRKLMEHGSRKHGGYVPFP